MKKLSKRIANKIEQTRIKYGLFRTSNKIGARILMYHGIDLEESKKFNGRFIGVKNFEKQLIYFKRNFNIVTLNDLVNNNFDAKKFTISITFDDGYLNNLKYAVPLLEKYEVPASIFITGLNTTPLSSIWSDFADIAVTLLDDGIELDNFYFKKKVNGRLYEITKDISLYEYIKKKSSYDDNVKLRMEQAFLDKITDFRKDPKYDDYWKLLSDENIKRIANSKYVTIGSHGLYHNNLGLTSLEKAAIELKKSKAYLENLTQKTVNSIAYPDGSYTRKVIDEAEKLNYEIQLAVDYLYKEDLLDQRIFARYGIYPYYSEAQLTYMIANRKEK